MKHDKQAIQIKLEQLHAVIELAAHGDIEAIGATSRKHLIYLCYDLASEVLPLSEPD